jgi:hypothetical protein
MEDPRLVNRAVAGFVCLTGVGCAVLALYAWSASPLVWWIVLMVGLVATCLITTSIYAVTVWPLMLLVAWVFGGRKSGQSERGRE